MKTTERNARFLVWCNGQFTKLTLRPGQVLNWSQGQATDEGWSRQSESWEHCGDRVEVQFLDEGRDCDGYLSHFYEGACPLDRLAASPRIDDATGEPVDVPEWIEINAYQRDESAEAAGY